MIRKYLTQRYPWEDNKWQEIIAISLFIAIFLMIFQPFGLSELQADGKYLFLSGYGLVTFIVLMLDLIIIPYIFPGLFNDEKWTVFKELSFLLFVLFTVGLGNLFYSSIILGFKLSVENIVAFQGYTLAIGIFPIAITIILKQNYLKRKNEGSARSISANLHEQSIQDQDSRLVRIESENEKEYVETLISDLLFIKSEGNYINVGYLSEGKPVNVLLRNTLKNASDLLAPYPIIFQCHRSWLVNLERIMHVRGNSQGLRLLLEGSQEDIPVARNTSAEFRQRVIRKMDSA
jgi:hypothetical protein